VVPPVEAFQVPASFSGIDVVTESFVAAAHLAGVAVHVWTINDEDEMSRLLELGVDGLVSDRPSVLAALLARRGDAWDGRLEA
jgi:glycerophosphoryl diester phosphodiesterase